MNELQLKYGCNPNQKPSRIFMEDGSDLPIQVLSGRPGYINFLDAFNGWQLVKELKEATGLPAATSSSMSLRQEQQSDCRLMRHWQKYTGWMIRETSHRWPARMHVQEVPTCMSSFGDFIALSEYVTAIRRC